MYNIDNEIEQARQGGAQYLHFDVMDGLFVPSISFGMPVLESIRKKTDLVLDVHLMIEKPERYIETFAQAGADIINFHLEATEHPEEVIKMIRDAGKKAAITIKPATKASEVAPYLKLVEPIVYNFTILFKNSFVKVILRALTFQILL